MPASLAVIRRRSRCEELWLEGHSPAEIARVMGISRDVVGRDLRAMSKRLAEEQNGDLEEKRAAATARKEMLLRETLNAFKLSQEPEELVKTEYKTVPCPDCEEMGAVRDDCPNCEGKGETLQEQITRSVKGKAGDAALLGVARQILADLDKISGIQAARQVEVSGKIDHKHETETKDSPYANMTNEQLAELRAKLEEAKANTPRIEPPQDAVDAEFEVKNAEPESRAGDANLQADPENDE